MSERLVYSLVVMRHSQLVHLASAEKPRDGEVVRSAASDRNVPSTLPSYLPNGFHVKPAFFHTNLTFVPPLRPWRPLQHLAKSGSLRSLLRSLEVLPRGSHVP